MKYLIYELEPRLQYGLRGRVNIGIEFNTLLIKYDGLGSSGYTTDFLEDCCLACICPSNDEDAKMRTVILLLEHCNSYMHYHNEGLETVL